MRILLVDDSSMMRALQKQCMLMLGIGSDEIVEAENGQVAIEEFSAEPFDLILTDRYMPVMDGLAFVKAVRSQNTDIPIVMLTTESGHSNVMTALEAGVSDYLVKPFAPDEFNARLRKWLPLNV